MALRTRVKYGLSAAMLALIAAGASAPQLLNQFLQEREGNTLVAVRDNGGVWSVCRGVTRIDGKPVVKGQRLTQSQCDHYNAIERDKALAWVNKHVHIPLASVVSAGRYYAGVYKTDPENIDILGLTVSRDGSSWTTAVTFGIDEIPVLDVSNIGVKLQEA
ncbi:TPA: glycoside hydrolase family protein [Salmonella enterica]